MVQLTVATDNSSDVRLHYTDEGSGQPVVLIHGYPLSSKAWSKQSVALREAGYRVISYDRRGFGESNKPISGYDADTFAADLHVLIEHLELEDAVLVGHSMGTGEVARYISRFSSRRITAVALISGVLPYLLRTEDNPNGAAPQEYFDEQSRSARADRHAHVQALFEDFFNLDQFRGTRISEDALLAHVHIADLASVDALALAPLVWPTDYRPDLATLDVPTLIIHGTEDRVLDKSVTATPLRKYLPNATYVEIDGAPHGLLWTHADEVNHALLDFLNR